MEYISAYIKKMLRLPSRRELLSPFLNLDGMGLEVGASISPVFPKYEGFNVKTLDYLDQEGLKKKSPGFSDKIEPVDYIWQGERYIKIIDGHKFDWILAAHVVEHVADIVDFLNNCHEIMAPGALLALVIPDKRFTFDYFRPVTSLASIIDAHIENKKVASVGSFIENMLYYADRGGKHVWSPGYNLEANLRSNPSPELFNIYDESNYDSHIWTFTPNHLRLILNDIYALELIRLRESAFINTTNYEFIILLSAEGRGPKEQRAILAEKAIREYNCRVFPDTHPKAIARSTLFFLHNLFLKAKKRLREI